MDTLFRNTLGPYGWILLGMIPPAIFALYFLKLKRMPLEVPSTYLWHRVIEDLHVNSLWQRLRKSLLLFLQLLIVGLAMLALLRPGWLGQSLEGRRFIFLIDHSASMSTTDAAGGQSRLHEAKQHVAQLIDQLDSDMSAMIISFAEQPDVVQEFTNNRRLLRESLDRIEPTAGRTDLSGALSLADGFANPARVMSEEDGTEFEVTQQEQVELYIFSDGRFRGVEGFSLGNLEPVFLPVGTFDANNLAITALNTRRNEDRPELHQAFVQIANLSEQLQTTVVELYLSGRLIDAAEMELPAGDVMGATFNLGDVGSGTLRAVLDPAAKVGDSLALDNTAHAVLEDRRGGRVLFITPGNAALESALETDRARRLAMVKKEAPDFLETVAYQQQSQAELYDLIIFDQCAPKSMPPANTLFIGRLPPDAAWQKRAIQEPVSTPQIIDWQRSHPLLNLVELGNVQLIDSLLTQPPLGGKVLIDTTLGPIFAVAPRDSYEDAVLGFEIVGRNSAGQRTVNTNWPRRHSFPNFCLNILEYLAGGSLLPHTQSHRPDKPVELQIASLATELEVELPDGTRTTLPMASPGRLAFHETDQLGVYTVLEGQEVLRRFAVNLFDREESDVRLHVRQEGEEGVLEVDEISIGYVDVRAQSPTTSVRRELWKCLLLGALAVLVMEWYIYNRRVYI